MLAVAVRLLKNASNFSHERAHGEDKHEGLEQVEVRFRLTNLAGVTAII